MSPRFLFIILFHLSSLTLVSCSLSLCLYVKPHLNILLHLVPFLSPSVLLVCFLSISIFLTPLPAPSYSFGIHPSFRFSSALTFASNIRSILHIKSLFTFILNFPPSYFLCVIKLPVDLCLTCRIYDVFALLEAERYE